MGEGGWGKTRTFFRTRLAEQRSRKRIARFKEESCEVQGRELRGSRKRVAEVNEESRGNKGGEERRESQERNES